MFRLINRIMRLSRLNFGRIFVVLLLCTTALSMRSDDTASIASIPSQTRASTNGAGVLSRLFSPKPSIDELIDHMHVLYSKSSEDGFEPSIWLKFFELLDKVHINDLKTHNLVEAYILNKIRESYDENDKSTGNAKLKNTNLKVAQNKAKSKIDEILKKFDLLAKDQNIQKTLHELSATFVLDYEQLKIRNVDDFEKAASFVDYCVIAVALNLHWNDTLFNFRLTEILISFGAHEYTSIMNASPNIFYAKYKFVVDDLSTLDTFQTANRIKNCNDLLMDRVQLNNEECDWSYQTAVQILSFEEFLPTDANEEIRGYVVYNQYAFIQLIVIRTFAHSFDELARNNKLESKINKKEVLNLRICFEILTASDHLTADNKLLRDGEDVQKASKKLKILSDKLNYEKQTLLLSRIVDLKYTIGMSDKYPDIITKLNSVDIRALFLSLQGNKDGIDVVLQAMLYGIIKRIPLDKHPLPNEFEQVAKSVERIGTSRKVIFDYVSAGRDLNGFLREKVEKIYSNSNLEKRDERNQNIILLYVTMESWNAVNVLMTMVYHGIVFETAVMEFFTTDYIIREMELPPEIQNLLNSPQLKLVKENLYKGYASEPGRIESNEKIIAKCREIFKMLHIAGYPRNNLTKDVDLLNNLVQTENNTYFVPIPIQLALLDLYEQLERNNLLNEDASKFKALFTETRREFNKIKLLITANKNIELEYEELTMELAMENHKDDEFQRKTYYFYLLVLNLSTFRAQNGRPTPATFRHIIIVDHALKMNNFIQRDTLVYKLSTCQTVMNELATMSDGFKTEILEADKSMAEKAFKILSEIQNGNSPKEDTRQLAAEMSRSWNNSWFVSPIVQYTVSMLKGLAPSKYNSTLGEHILYSYNLRSIAKDIYKKLRQNVPWSRIIEDQKDVVFGVLPTFQIDVMHFWMIFVLCQDPTKVIVEEEVLRNISYLHKVLEVVYEPREWSALMEELGLTFYHLFEIEINENRLYSIDELKELIDTRKQEISAGSQVAANSNAIVTASDDYTKYDVRKCTLWKMILTQIHLLLHKRRQHILNLFISLNVADKNYPKLLLLMNLEMDNCQIVTPRNAHTLISFAAFGIETIVPNINVFDALDQARIKKIIENISNIAKKQPFNYTALETALIHGKVYLKFDQTKAALNVVISALKAHSKSTLNYQTLVTALELQQRMMSPIST